MKQCRECKEEKALELFQKEKRCKDGRRNTCKQCRENYRLSRYEQNTDKRRNAYLKYTFNITLHQYNALLSEQGGKCAICEIEACATGKNFSVDHDHSCCGRRSCGSCIRGLLCEACNLAIGKLKDDKNIVLRAYKYLSES